MATPVDSHNPEGDRNAVERNALSRVERAVRRAGLNLLWESSWPLVAPFMVLAAFFAALSWLGLWRVTTAPVRYAILAAFAAALVYLVWRLFTGLSRPSRAAAFARVEQATGALHRPATSLADRLATTPQDPGTEALWIAHRQRLLAALERLRAGVPAPKLAARDPYAVRFLVALLFVVGFVTAGPERIERLGEAWQGGETTAAAIARIDAWVTPPAYTGRAPIFLTGDAARPEGTLYSVPVGSVVTVRTGGGPELDVISVASAGETSVTPTEGTLGRALPGEPAPLERVITLEEEGSVVVRKAGRDVAAWRFAVEPDSPPQITFLGDPKITVSGAIDVSYSVADDYGVVAAFGKIEPVREDLTRAAARPLYEAPALPLSLPQLRARSGSSQTVRDLTSHPWAGAKVTLTLVARDEAGQEGYSAPFEFTLPARQFIDLLARAVIEQRTDLALDANAAPIVGDALDALTFAPDKTIENKGTYLSLRSAYHRLGQARNDDDLRGIVDYLWSIALGIEDGDFSLAAQDLQAAQDALREALENNASDEEIARLTEELRQAIDKFLQAMMEQAQRNPQMSNLPPNANQQMLRSQDLQELLDQIQDLATTGARDAARQLLSQLQSMLENLQAGTPQNGQQGDNQAMQQMMENLNQLGEMIQQQQQLMEQTFRAQRGQNPSQQGDGQPMTREQLEQALRDLQQQQQGLQQSLQGLMQDMEGQGMGENGQLGEAGQAMGDAAGNLGDGRPGQAVTNQSDALDALRQGAQSMVQQLANANNGQRDGNGRRGGGNDQQFSQEDPLGRPQREVGADIGSTVKVPDEIDTQRAREILDAIRERLGELYRPELERDYLERLLNQF